MQQVVTEQDAPGTAGSAAGSVVGRQRKVAGGAAANSRRDAARAEGARAETAAAPRLMTSITVAAAAHEALFKAGPKLIFAEADAKQTRELALPRWLQGFVFSIHDGVGHLSALDLADGDAAPLALAAPPADCLGLAAFSADGAAALTACAAWFAENGPAAPPPVKLLGGRAEGERRTALLEFLVGRMHAEQAVALQRNADVMIGHWGLHEEEVGSTLRVFHAQIHETMDLPELRGALLGVADEYATLAEAFAELAPRTR